jgi:hypothetical protein
MSTYRRDSEDHVRILVIEDDPGDFGLGGDAAGSTWAQTLRTLRTALRHTPIVVLAWAR